MTKRVDLSGEVFNNWKVISYKEKGKYLCKCCLCGNERDITGYFLTHNQIPKCKCETGRNNKGLIDLTGETFGEWEVISYSGNKYWKCKCSCGEIRDVLSSSLRGGRSLSCGHLENDKGKVFGEWTAIGKGDTLGYLKCKCSCGKIKDVSRSSLVSGVSKSCGHSSTGFIDLKGQIFGELTALEYLGDGLWKCKCSCGKEYKATGYNLRNGKATSCGCKTLEKRIETCRERYIAGIEISEELESTYSRESLLELIKEVELVEGRKSTINDLVKRTGLDRGSMWALLVRKDLIDKVELHSKVSSFENELNDLFPCENRNVRILNGLEIDLYYPDRKFGIEFNGNYWHSSLSKKMKYHQEKTLIARGYPLRLFHIFEYEWENAGVRKKLVSLINRIIHPEEIRVAYARKCEVREIDAEMTRNFLNKYHLQGDAVASIKYGLFSKEELIGVMTFNEPRFNNSFEYELVRLAWKDDVAVVGGAEKLFKKFIRKYNPDSIISYCDASKFTGGVYERLGFTYKGISEPNYVWYNPCNKEVLNRYKTQKSRLVKAGLGSEEETEQEIMERLGYFRIYNSGNYIFTWNKNKGLEEYKNEH